MLDRKLLFVTGKGGVGKTTITAALGPAGGEQGQADAGMRDWTPKATWPPASRPRRRGSKNEKWPPGLWAMSMDTEASLRQYLSLQLGCPGGGIGPLARMFDFVASAAPGVREIVTIGKLCWEVRERHYDMVVVDAVASGHIVGQLAAPQAINRLVQVGLVRQQTDWMLDILSDPATTGVLVVATPEEMPVTETIELVGRLKTRDHRGLGRGGREPGTAGAVWHPGGAGLRGRCASLQPWSAWRPPSAARPEPLLEAARLMVKMRRSRAAHLERLREALGSRSVTAAGLLYVPYLFLRSYGLRSTRQVAAALAAELEN